jgi:hypothetical protein
LLEQTTAAPKFPNIIQENFPILKMDRAILMDQQQQEHCVHKSFFNKYCQAKSKTANKKNDQSG